MRRWLPLLVLLLTAACSRVNDGHGWGTAHEMTIVRANDPSSLNPLFAFDQPDIDLTQLYAEPLVGLGQRNELVPLVASRLPTVQNGDVTADGRTVTYHLRRGVRFADGTPLTSKDVAFTYRAILDPRNPVTEAQPYREIERLETPDPYTVVLHLRRPWAGAVGALFAETDFIYGILPARAFTSTDISHAPWNEHPYRSGPFRVVSWTRGDEIVLEPNPYAWRKPHLRRLVLKIVPDRNSELLLLRTHAIDVDDYLTNDQAAQMRSTLTASLVRTDKNHIAYALFQMWSTKYRVRRPTVWRPSSKRTSRASASLRPSAAIRPPFLRRSQLVLRLAANPSIKHRIANGNALHIIQVRIVVKVIRHHVKDVAFFFGRCLVARHFRMTNEVAHAPSNIRFFE